MDAVTARDMAGIMTAASTVTSSGADPAAFLEDVAALTRDIMAARLAPGSMAGREEKDRQKLTQWAAELDYDELQRFFNVLTDTMRNMKYSAQPHLAMEMGLLRLGEKRGVVSLDEAIAEVARAQAQAEKQMEQEPFRFPMNSSPAAAYETNLAPAPEDIRMAASGMGAGPEALLEAFKEARPILLGIMDNATAQIKGEVVVIRVTDMHSLEQLEEPDLKAILQDVARKMVCPTARVVVEYHGVKKNSEDGGARRLEERERSLKKQMMDSPIINEAMEIFSNLEVVDAQPAKGA